MSKQPEAIIGAPIGHVKHSKPYPCSKCGATVYLAPSGQIHVERDHLLVMCIRCALKVDHTPVFPSVADLTMDLGETGKKQ